MESKKKSRAKLCLVTLNGLTVGNSRNLRLTTNRTTKISRKFLDMTDPRVLNFSTGNLLYRSLRDSTASSHSTPLPLRALEIGQDIFMKGTHIAEDRPVFGVMQPSNGADSSLRYPGMGRPRQPAAQKSHIGSVFTQNAEALLPVSFPVEPNATKRIEALARRIGVGKETIRRAIKGGASSRLDIIDKIAVGLGVTTPELLTPGYGEMRAAELQHQARQEPALRRRAASFSI